MSLQSIWLELKEQFARNLVLTVLGAFLMAAALYGLVSFLTWLLYRTPGLADVLAKMAGGFGVETSQLLEFQALIVGGIFIAVQLWVTYRRVNAAERTAQASVETAKAAVDTAQSTVNSNAALLFKNAVELLGSDAPIVQIGGIQALGFLARDYPEYQEAVAAIIDNYTQQISVNQQSEGNEP